MSEPFRIIDKRGTRRDSGLTTTNLTQEMNSLRSSGYSLPKSNVQAREEVQKVKATASNRDLANAMRRTGSNLQMAMPKIRQPMSSLEDKGIPFDTSQPDSLAEIRRWARLFFSTHDLVPLLVDIYSKFPLVGLEFTCAKDNRIAEFYESMFMDTLDYETFLPTLAREYWLSGEVTSLAHFSEALGVWEAEEILNPDNVAVSKSIFQSDERVQLLVKPMVDALRDTGVMDNSLSESERLERNHEYQQLVRYYPEIIEAANRDDGLDLSDALVSRIVNRLQPWDLRGTPHLLRSFRALMMEESLNAAQDAVADRLYSPFILARLGVANLGDGHPWIPDQDDISATRDDMQTALAADFRLMVHNFGLEVSNVFGRESVPRFDHDYDRITAKLLQAWGIGESLIAGGSGGTYASSALNREFVTQMMVSFQNQVRRHILKRAAIVAEAQEHYDYERSGGQRKLIYREVVERDEETGEEYIVKRPKLLLPDVNFSVLNLRDEAQERAFMQQLKSAGVPISDRSLAVNIPIEFEDELVAQSEEQVEKLVAQAQAMKKAYDIIAANGLPIPPEMASYLAAQQQLAQAQKATEMAGAQAEQADAMSEHADDMADAQARGMEIQVDMAEGQAEMMDMQMDQMRAQEEQMAMQEQAMQAAQQDPQSLTGPGGQQVQAAIDGFDELPNHIPKLDPIPDTDFGDYGDPPSSVTPDGLVEEDGDLVQKLPRPQRNRPAESDEQRGGMPKRSLRKGPSHMRGRRVTASPTVRALVDDDDFYEALGYGGYRDQIRADLPDIEEAVAKDPDADPTSESHRILRELVDHHEYVTGESPAWG